MEGQQVDIEQRQPMFDGQQSPDTIENRLGRDDNRQPGPGVGRFNALDLFNKRGFERRVEPSGYNLEHLARFWSKQFAVAVDTRPVAVDKGHGIATDRTIGRRPFVESRQDRQFDIVFVHDVAYPSRGRIFNCNAFSALSRLGTPTNVSRPSMMVAGTARTAWRLASSCPSGVVISTSR